MFTLNIISKGNKYTISDLKGRTIYVVKSGVGGKTHLLDASGYKLYYFTYDKKAKKPVFTLFFNDKEILKAECTSMFLEPSFTINSEKINLTVSSNDRREFKIMCSEEQIGTVNLAEDKKDNQYILEISEKYFDDYIPLIAVFIDIAFGKINKG